MSYAVTLRLAGVPTSLAANDARVRSASARVVDDGLGTAQRRPSRVGGAPLAGAQAVELYRRTQSVRHEQVVGRLDVRA
ncbi:MAG: hypothetical protein HC809_00755 [Gammaproteobacteria bacterium]|nr:hypothetical protein [Gammaproteobacteria bacterium]